MPSPILPILFAGTPDFAAQALDCLLQDAHIRVLAVLTQPDRPAGRGMRLQESPVKQLAQRAGLEVLQPKSLKTEDIQDSLKRYQASLMVVAAYGLILPKAVLELFPWGCINIHASLLPRWRGAAPIHRAVWAGDAKSGVSIMSMDEGLDTGPVYRLFPIDLAPDETSGSLHDRLAKLGGEAIVSVLHELPDLRAQDQFGEVTYAAKVQKEEARINWAHTASDVERQIRALSPYPVAWTSLNGERLRIWSADVLTDASSVPCLTSHSRLGQVLAYRDDYLIACAQHSYLILREVQLSSGRRLSAKLFFAGHPRWVGCFLDMA